MNLPIGINRKVVWVTLIAIGVIFLAIHMVADMGVWVKSTLTPVSQPTTYRFPILDTILHQYVKDGLVDYTNLKKSPMLDQAVDELSKTSPEALPNADEKFAFWANAYNLLILKSICDKYPIPSPKKLGNSLSFSKFTVGGDVYSLRDIMEQKLDPYFRKHPFGTFLICGGAQGDPPLLNHVIDSKTMAQEAAESLKKFVNDPANARYDEITNTFYISAYFQRYEDDFIAYDESPQDFVAGFMDKAVPIQMATMIKTYNREFNWRLNDTAIGTKQDGPKPAVVPAGTPALPGKVLPGKAENAK